jgi:hypothetical protein
VCREGTNLEGQEEDVLYTSVPSHLVADGSGSLDLALPDKEIHMTHAGIYTLGEDEEEGEEAQELTPHRRHT